MKNLYTFILSAIITVNVLAQNYSENFDSFKVGDYIGVVGTQNGWTTWTGTTGGVSDVKITDVKAKSGSNSLYFSSSKPKGGPQDVILKFGGPYNSGIFTYEQSIFVVKGKGGYFNFQESNTPGTYLLGCYMLDDGQMLLAAGTNVVFKTTYPTGQWFTYRLEMDITNDRFSLYFDDVLKGSWDQAIANVASIDIFPNNPESVGGNKLSGFYIDDVSYNISATSTLEITNNDSFKIFPNPANNVTYISFENKENINPTVVIYDKTGKLISTIKTTDMNGVVVNTENFVPGLYIVTVKIGDTITKQKLIVE